MSYFYITRYSRVYLSYKEVVSKEEKEETNTWIEDKTSFSAKKKQQEKDQYDEVTKI